MTKTEHSVLERVVNNLTEMNSSLSAFREECNTRLDKLEAAVAGLRTGVIQEWLAEVRSQLNAEGDGSGGQ